MILVDTSAWIEFFRGRGGLAAEVDALLETNEVAICGPVITELRRGIRSTAERLQVLPLLSACHALDPPTELWVEAGELGFALSRKGVTVKSMGLLIAIFALGHGIAVLSRDRDFQLIRGAGIPLQLA